MGLTAGIVGVAATVGGDLLKSHVGARAARSQARLESRLAEQNAKEAERLAQEALSRGERDQEILSARAERLTGEQIAAIAAGGQDVSDATAQMLIADSKRAVSADIFTIKTNAIREAMGLKSQASNIRLSAQLNKIAKRQAAKGMEFEGVLGAFTSILGAASKFGAFTPALPSQGPQYSSASNTPGYSDIGGNKTFIESGGGYV